KYSHQAWERGWSLLLRPLPNRAVHFFVERWTARFELALFVVLRAHQSRGIAEGAANAFAIELAVLLQLPNKIRLRQGRAANADERRPAIVYVGGAGVRQKFLQITIAAADD